jgi:hypothetical protein
MRMKAGQRHFPWFSSASALEEDLQASVAEVVYGEPLRIPGELLTVTAEPVDPAHLITELHQHMARLMPVPASHHASPATFMHSDLGKCTHVFLCQNTPCQALQPPYWVLSQRDKTLQLLVCGRPVTVSTDRVKLAYTLSETDRGNNSFNPPAAATPTIASPAASLSFTTHTTRSGHHVHFPACFNI